MCVFTAQVCRCHPVHVEVRGHPQVRLHLVGDRIFGSLHAPGLLAHRLLVSFCFRFPSLLWGAGLTDASLWFWGSEFKQSSSQDTRFSPGPSPQPVIEVFGVRLERWLSCERLGSQPKIQEMVCVRFVGPGWPLLVLILCSETFARTGDCPSPLCPPCCCSRLGNLCGNCTHPAWFLSLGYPRFLRSQGSIFHLHLWSVRFLTGKHLCPL